MVFDMLSKTPYMKLDMVSKIRQNCQTLQPNKGFSIYYVLCQKRTKRKL